MNPTTATSKRAIIIIVVIVAVVLFAVAGWFGYNMSRKRLLTAVVEWYCQGTSLCVQFNGSRTEAEEQLHLEEKVL